MPVDMKSMIAQTLAEMIKTKNIDKITVKDLVETCGISRQTFYYHFQDLPEVIEWCADQGMRQALEMSEQAASPEEAVRIFISFSASHRDVLQKLLHSQKREQVEQLILRGLRSYLGKLLQRCLPTAPIPIQDADMALHFLSYGIAGLMLDYSLKKHLDEQTLARQISQLFRLRPADMMSGVPALVSPVSLHADAK